MMNLVFLRCLLISMEMKQYFKHVACCGILSLEMFSCICLDNLLLLWDESFEHVR